MRKSRRQLIRERDGFCCVYCGTTEVDVSSALTLDHVQPRSKGGTNALDNQVYCCHACNEFKGEYWQTEPYLRLLHPLVDVLTEHYQEQENGTLLGLTERGINHIRVLRLNREQLVTHRLREQARRMKDLRYDEMEKFIAELEHKEATNQKRMRNQLGNSEP